MECRPVYAGNELAALHVAAPTMRTERVNAVLALIVDRRADQLLPAFSGLTDDEQTALTIALANHPNSDALIQWWAVAIKGALEMHRHQRASNDNPLS